MYEWWRFQRYLICPKKLKIKISIRLDHTYRSNTQGSLKKNLWAWNCSNIKTAASNLNNLLLNVFRVTSVINLIFKIIFVHRFTLNFSILLFLTFCNKLNLSPVYSFFPTFCNKWILSLTIFCFRVLGLFRRFHTHTVRCSTLAPRFFVSESWVCSRVLGLFRTFHTHTHHDAQHPLIDPARCTKKKWSFSILILISNFLRQMRYHWNRHHSYIVNIVFLNNSVQKQTFFIFCIFVFIRYKSSPLRRVFWDRLCKSQRHGTTFLTARASRVRSGRTSSTVGYTQRETYV